MAALTAGKVAPDIDGTDLEGKPLRLSDYRGNGRGARVLRRVVRILLARYPYQRLMQDVCENRPLTILSVDSDKDPRVALKAKAERGLTYRSWWDGGVNFS